jgi:hypothetical protein
MPDIGLMLAGSAIGQGAGNFVHGQTQGAFDRARLDQMQAQNAQTQRVNDFQNNQMDRALQEQQIGDTSVQGATDADRLAQLSDIAGQAGRGDLQRKYSQAAIQARQGQALMGVANASRAITMGQFGPATQMLNQSGLFGQIQGIGLADDVEQDPQNPTYSVYTPGPPDANGNPTPGPHVHVTQQMLYALQSNPKDALHWISWAQAMGQKNTTAQNKVDAQIAHWNDMANHWSAQDAAAMQKAKALGAGGAAKLTDKRWLYQWAQSQIGKPGGFPDEIAAMTWAMDPNRQNKDYWQANRTALDIQKSHGAFTAADLADTLKAVLNRTPIANPTQPPPPPGAPPAPPADHPAAPPPPPNPKAPAEANTPQGPDNPISKIPGMVPVPGREAEGVYRTRAGGFVKAIGGKYVKWSNQANSWVSAK